MSTNTEEITQGFSYFSQKSPHGEIYFINVVKERYADAWGLSV